MKRYLLDTSVYGVLADKTEKDYDVVKKIVDYAVKNRECFVTTFIISSELNSEKVSKEIRDIILPHYLSTTAKNVAPLEIAYSESYKKVEKLSWNYIQRLHKKEASKAILDASNYAWASVAGIDAFVTRNRRGILADNYHKILKKSNQMLGLKFVEILRPKQFYNSLFSQI